MPGSTDAAALPHPELGAVMRLTRPLVAVIVVVVSAGAGYVGSLIWPMPTVSDSAMHSAPTGKITEPKESTPPLPTHVSKPAPTTDAIVSYDFPPPSQPSAVVTASLPEKAQTEVRGTSTSSPDSSVAVLHRAPAEQAHAGGRVVPKTSTGVISNERPAAARRKAASAKVSRIVRAPATRAASSSVVEFAPNPRANQAARDFMAHPSRN
jgi:type IV secretory pathway VirB10-like protein